jgi:hypothetical protein
MSTPDASAPGGDKAIWWEERTARVSQAAGMASAQADCSLTVALLLLEHRADELGLELEDTARSVLDRRARFSTDSPSDLLNLLAQQEK